MAVLPLPLVAATGIYWFVLIAGEAKAYQASAWRKLDAERRASGGQPWACWADRPTRDEHG